MTIFKLDDHTRGPRRGTTKSSMAHGRQEGAEVRTSAEDHGKKGMGRECRHTTTVLDGPVLLLLRSVRLRLPTISTSTQIKLQDTSSSLLALPTRAQTPDTRHGHVGSYASRRFASTSSFWLSPAYEAKVVTKGYEDYDHLIVGRLNILSLSRKAKGRAW